MDIFWVFAVLTILGLLGYGFQILAVRSHLSETKKVPCMKGEDAEGSEADRFLGNVKDAHGGSGGWSPVSILKPLKGLDDNLLDNLESYCNQVYPDYEIIFSLQDRNDPAFRLARRVQDKYPDKDITIVVERCNLGLNPKVNNLIPAYRASKHQYILISDSNVIVDRNYLKHLMNHMNDPTVGLVSNLIRGAGGQSIGSIFENLHLNSFVIGSVCFVNRFLRMPCVVGKSMLMRRDAFEAMGGFDAVKDLLAEDYIIGKRMQNLGLKVVVCGQMITNVNEYWTVKKFLNRHTRWGKLRWRIASFRYTAELMGNAVFMSFFPIILWKPSRITVSFAILVCLIKAMGDYYLGKSIGGPHKNRHYLLSPVKDLLMGVIWFIPLVNNRVIWRGNKYKIGKGTSLSPCTPLAHETSFASGTHTSQLFADTFNHHA